VVRRALPRRAPWLVLAAGVVAGVAVAAAEPTRYGAEGTVAAARAGLPSRDARDAVAVAALAGSDAVRTNVGSALGAPARSYRVERRGGGLVAISDDSPTSTAAVRTVQQVEATLPSFARSRFPALQVVTVDPAHATGRVSPHWVREPVLGAVAGAVLALALAAGRLGRRPRVREPAPSLRVVRTPPAASAARAPTAGRGLLAVLERRAAAQTDPADADELWSYVEVLRPFADDDGDLPAPFRPVVEEFFGPL